MIERFAKETGTSSAQKRKAGILHKLRDGMEYIFNSRYSGAGSYLSVLYLQEETAHAAQTFLRSRGLSFIAAITMTVSVYQYCAILAYLERGYKAYGGECLVALASRVLTYRAVSWWADERR